MRKLIIATSALIVGIIIASYVYFTNQDTVIITDSFKASRREVTDVPGVTFLINGDFNATPISKITDDAKFKKNRYYEYVGNNAYTLFSVNKMIIIAEKGTSYHFTEEEKPYQTLQKAQITDFGFKPDSRALNYVLDEIGANMNVTTTIKLNSHTENNYAGKLKTLTIDDTEWAIFAGYCSDSYQALSDEQKQEVNMVIESFKLAKQK